MTKNVNTARQVDFDTVVPASSPLASAVVVQAKTRVYLFDGDSTITRTEEHVIIRGWATVFVYKLSDIKARRLSRREPIALSSLPQERDIELCKTISHARPDDIRPAKDLCPDCIIPVVMSS